MSRVLYRLINPLVTAVLRSPLHALMSGNTVLLHFRGRRSGRQLRTPVSYHQRGDVVHCFASRDHRWWRNLDGGAPVALTLRGRRISGVPSIAGGDPDAMAQALTDFLTAVPRDAPHAGVRLDGQGRPLAADVTAAVPGLVHVTIRLSEDATRGRP